MLLTVISHARLFVLVLIACTLTPENAKKKVRAELPAVAEASNLLKRTRGQAFHLFRNQRYEEAIIEYLKARDIALAEKNFPLAIFFLNNVAGSYFALASYQNATKYFNIALAEAKMRNIPNLETMAAYNIASIHVVLGNHKQALESIRKYPMDGSSMSRDAKLDGFLLQANIFTRLGVEEEARKAFDRALAESELAPPETIQAANAEKLKLWPESVRELRRAWVYTVMGQCLVWMSHSEEAEAYIFEAFRIRSIFREKSRLRDALQLAIVFREKGNYERASQLLKVARDLDRGNRTPMHHFMIDREEARIALNQNDFAAAVPTLRSALAQARQWRMQVLPTDSAYLNFESYLTTEVHRAFLGAIANPSFSLNQKGLAEESFWVAEEARFASMRAAQFPLEDFASRFPSAYWQKLARFQTLQSSASRQAAPGLEELRILELELNALEIQAGLRIPNASIRGELGLKDWQRNLKPDEVVFSYYLTEPYSLAWIVDAHNVKVRRMPGKKQMREWIDQFRKEITDRSQIGNSSTGMELCKQLFGEELYSKRTTPFWTMVLDQELSTLPIAALPADKAGSRYLVEDHSLRVLPSALFLQTETSLAWTRQAVGIGDAIYNQADRRLSPMKNASVSQLELNRLPASAKELQISLNTMKNQHWLTVEHTGLSATVTTLGSTLNQSPDILHLSTHFVPQAGNPHLLNIALSPTKGQTGTSLFSSLDLNAVRTKTKLVVLSGCSSSTGEVISGIGINGLSRAFLISGVSTVLATLWPTEDTEGPIFPVFYQNLIQQKWSPRAAAESLRAAQLQMIRQGGWSSKPSYWAAYLAISKG